MLVGEEQSSEKDAATVNEVSEELPVHPRKRKLTRARINNEPAELVVPIELPVDPHNLYIIDKQDNPYRSVRDLKKKVSFCLVYLACCCNKSTLKSGLQT